MKTPPQFTTVPNSRPAPTWEGSGLYWNPDYIAHVKQSRKDAQEPPRAAEPVQAVSVPYGITFSPAAGTNPPAHQRVCSECGERFSPSSGTQQTCSRACSETRRLRVYRERTNRTGKSAMNDNPGRAWVDAPEWQCTVCGATYRPVRPTQKTCGKACAAQRQRQLDQAAKQRAKAGRAA